MSKIEEQKRKEEEEKREDKEDITGLFESH